jgi:hypothetical protein
MGGMETFETGDEITPTESELEAFPDRFRELRNVNTDESVEQAPFDPTGMTVAEVGEALEDGSYDSEGLDDLEAAEENNDDRAGVYDAIDEQR